MVRLILKVSGTRWGKTSWKFYFGKWEEPFEMYAHGIRRELAEAVLKNAEWKFVSKTWCGVQFETQVSDDIRRTLVALKRLSARELRRIKESSIKLKGSDRQKFNKNLVTMVAIAAVLT